jgi:hypothetical protein
VGTSAFGEAQPWATERSASRAEALPGGVGAGGEQQEEGGDDGDAEGGGAAGRAGDLMRKPIASGAGTNQP